jgi:hypothetical protein
MRKGFDTIIARYQTNPLEIIDKSIPETGPAPITLPQSRASTPGSTYAARRPYPSTVAVNDAVNATTRRLQ